MTRKDFEAMARAIVAITDIDQRKIVASTFIGVAKQSNDRFDEDKFREACGLPN